ncbi:phosphoglycerate mutase family protein [Pontibacter ruber]|uniref:Phosphoglycerate mutase family protein n=1 Tax=Pontibacter ruber TaxID=1343895 RepID=A0ABW5CTT0_9BACT|nr:phosphoglycerate mutase family protein [Pontibacter ruber]
MRLFYLLRLCLVLFVAGLVSCRTASSDKDGATAMANPAEVATTTVYLVRHAEKDISDPANQDPDLTETGKARAEALRELLKGQEVNALYATKYIRTQNTLKPLADERKLDVIRYEAHDFIGLFEKIKQQHPGQVVVVAGHSNTILPLVEAFGAERPIPEIADNQYDYLFKVQLNGSDKATVEMSQFGSPSN